MSTTEERLMLEMMANMVECVLGVHRKPCRVLGGTLGPQVIRLHLKLAPHIRVADVERLADDLALGLHVPDVRVERSEEGVRLEFVNPHPRPIGFRSMMETDAVYPARSRLLPLPAAAVRSASAADSWGGSCPASNRADCGMHSSAQRLAARPGACRPELSRTSATTSSMAWKSRRFWIGSNTHWCACVHMWNASC